MRTKNKWNRVSNQIPHLFLVLLLIVVPFYYSGSVLDPSLYPRLFALNITITVFGLLILFQSFKKRTIYERSIFRKNIFKFYPGYILVALISILFALNTSEALFEWFKIFTFFITFCLLVLFLNQIKNATVVVTKIVILFSILISLYGFYEIINVASTSGLTHQATYSVRALSSNRNLYSQLLFLTLPFTVFGVCLFRKLWRILSVPSSVFAIVLVTVLLTRSVWIAIMFSVVEALIILVIYRKYFALGKKAVRMLSVSSIIVVAVVATGILIYMKFGDAEVFKKQFYWVSNYRFGSTMERVELWRNTMYMSEDHPVTGVGQGNWRFNIPLYGVNELRSSSGETYFQRPHNDFLWVLSENGIIGLLLYILIFVSIGFYLFSIIKKAVNKKDRYLALSLISGLSGYIIISLVSFPRERVEHQIFLSLMMAVSVVKYNSLVSPERKNIKIIPIAIPVIILMVFATFISYSRVESSKHILKALDFRSMQKWNSVISEIKMAETPFTTVDNFSTPLCWYAGEAYFRINKIDRAFNCFVKSYEVNPNHLQVLNNLGTTFELKKQHNKAKKYFVRAIDLSPHFKDALLNLAAIYYNEGNTDSAYLTVSKINDTVSDARYGKFLSAILMKKIDELSVKTDDRELKNSLIRIRHDQNWMKKVYHQARNKNVDIEKQLLEEGIYLMEVVDSTITPVEAQRLKTKFNLPDN